MPHRQVAAHARLLGVALGLLLLAAPAAAPAQEPPGAAGLAQLGIALVRVPGGQFPMGFEDGEDEERPVHQVTVRDFFLGRTEVTQAQWAAVMGKNPSRFAGCDDCPVESVSWKDAQEFLKALGARVGAPLRLPTEAEWERAAGGPARTRWAGTDSEGEVGEFAWFAGNAGGRTHPVAALKPNALGLYDMSGNVWEWCEDWHDGKYYAVAPAENPRGPERGFARILRGGSWINSVQGVRVGIRHRIHPEFRSINLNGLRIAADAP